MVNRADRRGLVDWLAQRFTAVLLGAYAVFILLYLLLHPGLSYLCWRSLFDSVLMRIATVLVVFSVLWHAWVGLWTVLTDYVKRPFLRFFLESVVIVLLLAYFIWVLEILWH